MQGLRDGVAGSAPLLTEEEIQAAMQSFQQEIMAKQEAEMKVSSDKNKQASEAFLAETKKKQGVTTTASGLQYEVITPGSGESPKPTDQVTVHYRGTLADGTVFDSSYDRGEPATFPVNGVIKGWVEALQLMKPGAKYKLVHPARSRLRRSRRRRRHRPEPGAGLRGRADLDRRPGPAARGGPEALAAAVRHPYGVDQARAG